MSNTYDLSSKELLKELQAARQRIAELEACPEDITASKMSEDVFKDKESCLRALLDATGESVALIDTSGNIIALNGIYAARIGLPQEELLGVNVYSLFPSDIARSRKEKVDEVVRTKRPAHFSDTRASIIFETTVYPVINSENNVSQLAVYARDITERKRAEEALNRRSHELGERVKELRCVYGLSHLATDPEETLPELLQKAAELIPPAWQYPEATSARITVDGQAYQTDNFLETAWRQSSDIVASGEQAGTIEVFYSREMPEFDEGPFLTEERELIDVFSERFGMIIERKRAEEALQQSEMHFRALVENAPFGIAITSAEEKVEYVNPMLSKLFGYSIEDVPDLTHWWSLAYPDPAYREETKALWENLVEQAHGESGGTGRLERRTTSVNGNVRDIEFTYTALGSRGLTTYFDVTERRKAEEALREHQARLQLSLDAARAGVWIWDVVSGKVWWDDRMQEIFGLAPATFDGTFASWKKLVHPEDLEVAEKATQAALEDAKPYSCEYRVQVNNEWRFVHACAVVTRDSAGMSVRMAGMCRDVTERKEFEKALRDKEKTLKQQAREMEEVNTALTVLLKRRDQEKQTHEESALSTMRTLVFPFLKKLSDSGLSSDQETSLAIAISNLNSVYSPFASRLAPQGRSLTPAEIHIAELIKQGKSSKEIARVLSLSEETISTHRKNIRAKFGILNQKINLRTYLQSLASEPRI